MIKGFLLKGKRGRERTWDEREGWEGKGEGGEDQRRGGILLQGLRGDRRPWVKAIQGHRSPTVFEILTFKARKWLSFPTLNRFDAPAWGNLLEFLIIQNETYPAKKTIRMEHLYGEIS